MGLPGLCWLLRFISISTKSQEGQGRLWVHSRGRRLPWGGECVCARDRETKSALWYLPGKPFGKTGCDTVAISNPTTQVVQCDREGKRSSQARGLELGWEQESSSLEQRQMKAHIQEMWYKFLLQISGAIFLQLCPS